ncbi:Dbl homology domain-containing protein [Syncephalis plumigaleata]|nr:Dbl homology domain-containing protein [Syncephalis plumigaleata]
MTSSNSTTILLSALSTVLSSRNRTRSIISNGSSIMSTFSSVRSSSSSASSVCSSRAPSIASIPLLPSTIGKHHRAARAPVRLCDAIRPYTSIAELLDSLFAQLNMFIDLQTKLVCALRELDPNTATHQQVARAFLDLSKAFEVYADYADGHATALAAFENLRLTNPRFRRHLRHLQPSLLNDGYDVDTSSSSSSSIDLQELQTDTISSSDPARTEKNPMELTSLLSLPLKRIWHYVSLFETLKRHAIQAVPLGDRQPTLGAIQEFMDTLDSLDLRMNTNKRQIERVCQIAQLQRKIRHLPSLLLTHRQFILHEGMISWSNGEMKKPTHHSQRKEESRNSGSANSQETTPAYCWLLRDRILLGHQRASGAYTHKMTIRLSECTVYAPPVDMGRRNSSSSDRSSSSSSNSNSSSNSDMNTGRSLYIATADTHIRLHFDERRAFERWCGQIRLALTTLPRDSNKPTESGRIINANTAERWNPAHAGCYVHVDVFPFL